MSALLTASPLAKCDIVSQRQMSAPEVPPLRNRLAGWFRRA
jgi:hypothetical protein